MNDIATKQLDRQYVELALAMEQHSPGYIDAYYGPPEWKEQAEEGDRLSLNEIVESVDSLKSAIDDDESLDAQRRNFLTLQVRAMQTSARILQGERPSLLEEVSALYDIRPEWVDETVFREAHSSLDELLPPGDSLRERMTARKRSLQVSVDEVYSLLDEIINELRLRTTRLIDLPSEESLELNQVSDQPWPAYNWYLGDGHSRIDLNKDSPFTITDFVYFMAHEGYPGHHTERTIKDLRLYRDEGRFEHCVVLINSPEVVVSEGIATCALNLVMSGDELVKWQQEAVYPKAGFAHLNAEQQLAIEKADRVLEAAKGNAAILLHDQGAEEQQVVDYLQKYALMSEQEAKQLLRFMNNPLFRSYIFTYRYGREMLTRLFSTRGNQIDWLRRLLNEPVTPTQIRAWINGEEHKTVVR